MWTRIEFSSHSVDRAKLLVLLAPVPQPGQGSGSQEDEKENFSQSNQGQGCVRSKNEFSEMKTRDHCQRQYQDSGLRRRYNQKAN